MITADKIQIIYPMIKISLIYLNIHIHEILAEKSFKPYTYRTNYRTSSTVHCITYCNIFEHNTTNEKHF